MDITKRTLRALDDRELVDLVATLYALWACAPRGSDEERRCEVKWARAGEELVRRERRRLRRLGRLLEAEGLTDHHDR
jgi:hypothetical protein